MKICNTFNTQFEKKISELIQKENDYISKLFDILPIPDSALQDMDDQYDILVSNGTSQNRPQLDKKTTRAQTLEELHNRLNDIKTKRNLNYKDKLLKKGLKNRIKKKNRKDLMKMKKKTSKVDVVIQETNTTDNVDTKIKPAKPIFNNQGKMVFSKFDFRETEGKPKNFKPKTEKNPRKILKQIEKQKDKLKQLESGGEKDKAVQLKEKFAWKSALAKAEGQKVKDDPELLKKSVMHREQKVKQSQKKWENRKDALEKASMERQKKRSDNINKRKKEKKNNIMKRAAKRGRVIAGF